MSTNTVNNNMISTDVVKTSLTKESVWNKRTVQVGSGISSAILAGGAIALGVLGGPLTAIVAVATAAFIALIALIKSIVSKPNVTSVETKTVAQEKAPEPAQIEAPKAATIEAPAAEPAVVAQEAPVVEPTTTTTEEVAPMPVEKEVRFKKVREAFTSAVNFAKAHPYKTAIGVTAGLVALGGLGYGAVAAYGALTAPAMMAQGLNPVSAGIMMPAPKAPVCPMPLTQAISQNVTNVVPEPAAFTMPLTQTIYQNATNVAPEAPVFTLPLTEPVYQNISNIAPVVTPSIFPLNSSPVLTGFAQPIVFPTNSTAVANNATLLETSQEQAGKLFNNTKELAGKAKTVVTPLFHTAKNATVQFVSDMNEQFLEADQKLAGATSILTQRYPSLKSAPKYMSQYRVATVGAAFASLIGLTTLYKAGKAAINCIRPTKLAVNPLSDNGALPAVPVKPVKEAHPKKVNNGTSIVSRAKHKKNNKTWK